MKIFCHSALPEFQTLGAQKEQWNLSGRVASLLKPGDDKVILPTDARLAVWWSFLQAVLGLHDDQVMWTSGQDFLLDDEIGRELMPELLRLATRRQVTLFPYAASEGFERWATKLGSGSVRVFGDNPTFFRHWSDKACLHHHVHHGINGHSHLPDSVPVPLGFVCDTTEDLVLAASRLRGMGVERFVVKPRIGSAGDGITFIASTGQLQTYDFPFGSVLIEQHLEIDRDEQGEVIVSVQYMGDRLYGDMTDQNMNGCSFSGGSVPSRTTTRFQMAARRTAETILKTMNPRGPGGFDFLSVHDRPVLVDPNPRFTESHPPKMFVENHAPGSAFRTWSVSSAKNVWDVWGELHGAGLAFIPGESRHGVFPIVWIPGVATKFIAIAPTGSQVRELKEGFAP